MDERGDGGVDTQLRREGIAPTSDLAHAQSSRIPESRI